MKARQAVRLFALATIATWLTGCGGSGGSNTPPATVISVALSPAAPTSLATGATSSLTAVVSNDSSNAGVKWTVTCGGGGACGTFSAASSASGVATTYTAPSVIPAPATVTVTATSVTDTTKTASATITITVPAISVALSPTPPPSVAAGSTASLTAVVANDSANAGVKWTVTCGSSACGSFAPTSTASGTATTYTAPSTVPTPATVTVTATSVTDTTKTASATITIAAPGVLVVLSPTPTTSLIVSTTTSLTAVVSNDSANAGVKWTVTCGNSACGSFSSTSTASGAATTYTAPSAPPTPATVTITATSVTDTTKTATATITITYILANGTYVFHWAGNDSSGPYFVAGAFTMLNGVITAGEQDFSDVVNGYYTKALVLPTSLVTAAADGNIQIVLDTGNTNIGVSGVETLRGVRVSGTRVLISEFDTFASATGSVDLQTSTAGPSGGYAFAVRGTDGSTSGFALGVGGVLNISGSNIVVASSVLDFNDGGTVGKAVFLSSGSVTTPDTFGRITLTITPNTSALLGIVLTGYIVSPNQIQLVESQVDAQGSDLGGMALGQGSHTGTFTTASASGSTFVFTGVGADAFGTLHIGGALLFNSNNTMAGTVAVNDFTNFGSLPITGGNYLVDATGRVSITNVTPSLAPGTPFAFQLYLDGNGNALELGIDNSQVNVGPAYQQTVSSSAPFAGAYALSGQGFGNLTNTPAWGAVGPVTVASNAFTGFTDYTLQGGTPISNATLAGTETSATGILALTGLNAASSPTSNNYLYFPIDAKRVIAIETDGSQLGLLLLEGVSP